MSEQDVQISYGEGFDALLQALAGVKRPGNYFSSGAWETLMPAIEVDGVGMLSFPVPAAQARELIGSAAERAPYGRGSKTLVDESVRKVWQVPAEKTRISGKGWAASLETLVGKVAEELGCEDAKVTAEFYKLLAYEKGGFFLPHRDSEKTGGMFGTLVITLPSRHEGGELVIRHAGRETVLDLRGEAPSEIHYAAFYADCEHEVKPVRSGFRVCLVYNLVQKRKTRLQPPDHRPAIAAAAPLLAEWAGRAGKPGAAAEGEGEAGLAESYRDPEEAVPTKRNPVRRGRADDDTDDDEHEDENEDDMDEEAGDDHDEDDDDADGDDGDRGEAGGKRPEKIVYLLEHHYTQAALAFAALKGADAALAQVLVAAAAQAKCAVHLGIVHIEESGWAEYTGGGGSYRRSWRSRWPDDDDDDVEEEDSEYEVGEVCDGRYYIDQWRAVDDTPVEFGEIPIRHGEILPPGALDGEKPDESHFSEATGNSGASFARTYLRAALVLWPEERFDHVCASAGPDAALARLELLVRKAKRAAGADRATVEKGIRRLAMVLPRLGAERPVLGDRDAAPMDRLSRLVTVLTKFGDADLLLEAAEVRLLEDYDGRQNRALLAAIPVLGGRRAADLLTGIVGAQGPEFPAAVTILWTLLAMEKAGGDRLLAQVLDAWIEAIPHYKAPQRPAWATSISRFAAEEFDKAQRGMRPGGAHALTSGNVADFLRRLHASACAGKMRAVIRCIVEMPELFSPEKVLLPALETIGGSVPAEAGPADLWEHCARHYLQRSERAPEPPRDWAQMVKLPGNSPLIRELEAFARNPKEQVHRFRARKELRQEIHGAIERAGLDMTHVTERVGSPQTLVCTKTRATYERACRQYESDRVAMRRLLALKGMVKAIDGDIVARMQRSCG